MKTVKELTEDFVNAKVNLKKLAKLSAFEDIRGQINKIELKALGDASFPLAEIRESRGLLKDVDEAISKAQSSASRYGWR